MGTLPLQQLAVDQVREADLCLLGGSVSHRCQRRYHPHHLHHAGFDEGWLQPVRSAARRAGFAQRQPGDHYLESHGDDRGQGSRLFHRSLGMPERRLPVVDGFLPEPVHHQLYGAGRFRLQPALEGRDPHGRKARFLGTGDDSLAVN